MTTDTNTNTTFTAIRTWHGKQARVTVFADGIEIAKAGGERAKRAQAVIVTKWHGRDTAGIYGLRSSVPAAMTEAVRLATPRTVKNRHSTYTYDTTGADLAICVLVEEPV